MEWQQPFCAGSVPRPPDFTRARRLKRRRNFRTVAMLDGLGHNSEAFARAVAPDLHDRVLHRTQRLGVELSLPILEVRKQCLRNLRQLGDLLLRDDRPCLSGPARTARSNQLVPYNSVLRLREGLHGFL